MSEKIDKFCEDLRSQLSAVDDRIQSLKSKVQASAAQSKEQVEADLNKAKADLEASKQKVEAKAAQMKAHLEAKKAETEEQIAAWKHKREVSKLEKRADRAENYAANATIVAAAAVDEADYAIVDAIAARIVADEAASA